MWKDNPQNKKKKLVNNGKKLEDFFLVFACLCVWGRVSLYSSGSPGSSSIDQASPELTVISYLCLANAGTMKPGCSTLPIQQTKWQLRGKDLGRHLDLYFLKEQWLSVSLHVLVESHLLYSGYVIPRQALPPLLCTSQGHRLNHLALITLKTLALTHATTRRYTSNLSINPRRDAQCRCSLEKCKSMP